ncbi:uncharacterized protein SPSC_05349 [Sporisorium scitamineum]|uniref:INO80 complex subunit B-like conserved region domain-containing protein n=1 Tax=Sporisorium scitamineum TaxID=49012 RepID=A0A127ZHG5_9BASI|nr:uncharacterized protein SPSC_05349 [Sporisorium scitamineum]
MPIDYDALSDGSELTGEDSDLHREEDDEETMASAPRTPSKKRRRILRAMQDDEEDEDEVADALEDDDDADEDVEEQDADELDEDDEEYDAPSSSRRGATRTSGRKSAASSSTPKRSARTSVRTASTPTASSGKKSLRVKLTRTPNSAAAAAASKEDSSPASKGRPSISAAASSSSSFSSTTTAVSTPPSRRSKDATKIKWKPRNKTKESDDEDLDLPDVSDNELDEEDLDPSPTRPIDDPLSASASDDEDASEPDEATAAEMQAIIGKTARQLAREGGVESEHMELPMFDPNRKKKLTENELALRRSETARKRKNQVEKKLEDDKVETINRLLKKQVGRSRNKLPRAGSAEDSDEEAEQARKRGREEMSRKALKEMPAPFFRYIDRAEGKLLAVPTGPPLVEEVFGANYVQVNQALIEELDTPTATDGLSEKAKAHEEKARKRLKAQSEQFKQDRALDQIWGPEGLYEYQLRTVLGQSRNDWIGSRRPPTPQQEEQPQEEDAQAEAEVEGEQQEEYQSVEAADDAEDDKE